LRSIGQSLKPLTDRKDTVVDFLVFCTFDLKGATAQNYIDAYADLAKMGLKRVHVANNGANAVIPTTSAMGVLQGVSAASVRDAISSGVQTAFRIRGFISEIFVTAAGGDWGWAGRTT
jgi:hypothetical protein